MQVVAVVDVGRGDFVLDRGKVGTNFFAELGLNGGVPAEEVDAPTEFPKSASVAVVLGRIDLRQRSRGSLVSGNKECHHLINQVLILKASGL